MAGRKTVKFTDDGISRINLTKFVGRGSHTLTRFKDIRTFEKLLVGCKEEKINYTYTVCMIMFMIRIDQNIFEDFAYIYDMLDIKTKMIEDFSTVDTFMQNFIVAYICFNRDPIIIILDFIEKIVATIKKHYPAKYDKEYGKYPCMYICIEADDHREDEQKQLKYFIILKYLFESLSDQSKIEIENTIPDDNIYFNYIHGEVSKISKSKCGYCGILTKKWICPCDGVFYCNITCQKADWVHHRSSCNYIS